MSEGRNKDELKDITLLGIKTINIMINTNLKY